MNDPLQTVNETVRQSAAAISAESLPQHIGRYRVERLLGKGGFGLVYLAHDEQLQRLVAIKVPHRAIVARPEEAEVYLQEARTVANLDHPNIVPVHDYGSSEHFPCFIVSKFIEGSTLAEKIKKARLSVLEAVEIVAIVAQTLHYAHCKGLVHRDVKPENILLDPSGKPYMTDFGLALREQDVGTGPCYAGTPAYMSPEQARGEGHRVDGRSDIFSLGIVFYELLTGHRAFHAESRGELLEQITNKEVRPPRQWDDTIPKELERICLKSLAQRASQRYKTAQEVAEDLRYFLAEASAEEKATVMGLQRVEGERAFASTSSVPTVSLEQAIRIVPKGLRSFDAADADFFLELFPGPRDRDGLPVSIRFWKSRIETTEAENTFAVGLIYGPSGCGKSSLVKAGLLPRLAKSVTTVYVEATGEEMEARLLKALRRQCPQLPRHLGLIASLTALRQGKYAEADRKVLLVLDQFEQWLHAKPLTPTPLPQGERGRGEGELVQALRQCDGGRLQCIVLVRDDFWMAATRFMAKLEINLVQGQNCAAVDLFDLFHARKVLAAFGRAYDRLPNQLGQCSREQNAFLDQAVVDLAEDGKVVSVRLALFAEMVKDKPWTSATLHEVGGIEGVGVTFLEETFTASTALPEHRLHQKAAQAVLKALLPETSTDIKGNMRSQQQLLAVSGYANRPKEFADLLRILDGELRLITPTDPEGKEDADPSTVPAGGKYYQLTHDYLVPSLRDWLTRKQKETRRGRAELLLADRAALWITRPENRQLPSLLHWLQIRWLTSPKSWTPPERTMMRKARSYHALRGLAATVVLVLLAWAGYETHGSLKAHALRDRLVNAHTADVPAILQDVAPYRPWLDPLLHGALSEADKNHDRRKQLHASLALLPVDATQVDYLSRRLLDAEPGEVPVIRDALDPHKEALIDKLCAVVEAPPKGKEAQRLRAAAALAQYDPENEKWAQFSPAVVNDLVRENPVFLLYWSEAYQPVKHSFLQPLADIFRDRRPERAAERSLATNLLSDYAADKPRLLTDLLLDADDHQFTVIYPKFREQGERVLPLLSGTLDQRLPSDLPSADEKREKLAKRQANAAVALLRMNHPEKAWPLLKHRSDPRVRSYMIHRLGPLGTDAETIIQRLAEEPDITIRRALILSLGEFREKEISPDTRQTLLPKLRDIYRTDTDPGLHAAVEWLLRTWRQQGWLKQVNEEWAKDKLTRQKRLESIRRLVDKDKEKAPPQWFVNGQGQTMVVIPGPVEFVMGSPPTEAERDEDERQHQMQIGRTFALAATSVTWEQYRKFDNGYQLPAVYTRMANLPVVATSWHQAAAYCNWLSKEEGLAPDQWCYEIRNGQVTRLKANYLNLAGYRLPTEAEIEYATRAETLTSQYYGETEELLRKYAWYVKNSQGKTWPVGMLKPNDFGLFDMLGNVYTWCQERYRSYPQSQAEEPKKDEEDISRIDNQESRVMRGGSFRYPTWLVRSAYRNRDVPTYRGKFVGFRPAITLPR